MVFSGSKVVILKAWEQFCSCACFWGLSSAACVWTGMYCDCCHSREMQYKWLSPALKKICSPRETWYCFAQLSSFFCPGYNCFILVKQLINLKQTSFDVWLLVCLHVDILFCHFPNRRGDRNQTFKGNALFERCSTSLDHQQSHCCTLSNVSTHSDNTEGSEINIYTLQLCSTKRHTVAWQISLGCCWFPSSSVFFCFLFPSLFPIQLYFYNSEKHLIEQCQETYSFSLVVRSLTCEI